MLILNGQFLNKSKYNESEWLIVRGPSKGNSDWLVVTQVQVQQL